MVDTSDVISASCRDMAIRTTLQTSCSTYFTYLCLFARWEHRPSTKERHCFLSVAILSISLRVYPISFVSFSVSLPDVSWPTFSLLPWGVPCDGLTGDGVLWFPECMSYPPPFSLLYFIFIGLVIFQSVVLDILSVHFRCRILRRHLLMKVCILFSVFCVLRHVSDP